MRFSPFIERMFSIIVVFLASFIIIGSIAYILYSYTEDTEESFGTPSRTTRLLSSQKNCNVPKETGSDSDMDTDTDSDDEDDDGVISMEDVLKMRNGKGESVHQKLLQKSSGMGYRDGTNGAGPSPYTDQVTKPENQLSSSGNLVWKTDSGPQPGPPSHLMGALNEPSSGGILPGLDREKGGAYSPL